MKLVIEPAAATGIAALLDGQVRAYAARCGCDGSWCAVLLL